MTASKLYSPPREVCSDITGRLLDDHYATVVDVNLSTENNDKITKDAFELYQSSTFCCVHIKAVAVFLLVLAMFCFVCKYTMYAMDFEVFSIFELLGISTVYDNPYGRTFVFVLDIVCLLGLFIALVTNRQSFLYPYRALQVILILCEIFLVVFYCVFAINGNLGYRERQAVNFLLGLGFPIFDGMSYMGDGIIALFVALTQAIFVVGNCLIQAILDCLSNYMKRRTAYDKMVNELFSSF